MAPALVLLHAFPLNSHLWDGQVEFLRGAGYTVVAPDLAGFGQSPLPAAPSLLESVQPVLDGLSSPAVFAGLSMGGYMLMEILRKAPDAVAGAVFIDTKATADSPQARATRLEMARVMDDSPDMAALADALLPNLVGQTTINSRPEVVSTVRGWIEQAPAAAVANAQRMMADRLDSVPVLRRYEGLAAVVYGSEDTLSPKAEQSVMLEAMPQAVAREIPGVGHLSAVEDASAVNDILLDILRDWLG
jgi:pimeloyl-ACP methyl ester carboxylesterase